MAAGLSIKKFLPRTLFGRSLLILITPVVLIQIIATYIFFDRHWGKVTSRLAYAVAGEIATITALYETYPYDRQTMLVKQYADRYLALNVKFKPGETMPAAQNSSVVQIWEAVVAQKLSHEMAAKVAAPYVVNTDFNQKTIEVYIEMDDGVLQVTLPQRRLYSSSGYIFLLWMIATSFLLLLIAIVFMRNQIRPIRKLAAAAELFGKGRDTPFFKPEGAREVRQAGHAFMDMRRRIQRQISQRTEMLAGVSHDLRTPLTRMKLQVEMMPAGPDKDEMRDDIHDMQRMVEGYLDFVRGEGDEKFEQVYVLDMLQKLGETLRRQNVNVQIEGVQNYNITARPLAFHRALSNLMTNAAKYADSIWVSVSKDGEKVQIRIEDNGPGVPEDKFEDVFKPFYRVDTSRNARTGGVGLGLPIAMDIVHAHGGKIWLEKSSHGGLCVVVRMPV